MALQPDDEVCFCFHVSLRKIVNFCRIEKPKVASQISQCLSAGTGCGWCRPILRRIQQEVCRAEEPWWRKQEDPAEYHSPERDASPNELDAAAYAAGRQKYLKQTGAKPPE